MNKLLTTGLVGVGLLAGVAGGIAYDAPISTDIQEQLTQKTELVEQTKVDKMATDRDYIKSQITSNRTPVFTGAMTSDEMTNAYIEVYRASGGDMNYLGERMGRGEVVDLKSEIIQLSEQKGEMMSCVIK
jgi:hypothetical protein